MSTWFNDAWAYVLSLTADLDVRSVLSFLGQKLFEGLFQAVAVVVIGWLVAVSPVAAAYPGQVGPGRLFREPLHAARRSKISPRRMESGICSSSEPCWHPRRSTSFWTTWRFASSCVTWPNRPPWRIRSSRPRERPASRSSMTSSIASREAWHPHRFGAISGSWRSPARIGESSGNAVSACSSFGAPTSSAWHPGSGAAGTSWSRRGITTGESSHSTRSRFASRKSKRGRSEAAPKTSRQTSCRWSIARLIIPGFASCRWA